jgi:hypothetical protein
MRYRVIATLVLLSCCLPAAAQAGRIFGDVKLDGKPLPAGVSLKIARLLPGEARTVGAVADSTATDKFGAYKLMVKEPGKCVLTIVYEKQTATLDVFSYKEATRYDLVLEKKGGTLSLLRK